MGVDAVEVGPRHIRPPDDQGGAHVALVPATQRRRSPSPLKDQLARALLTPRAYLNSICFSCLVTMATSGGRPVLSWCSSALEAMIWVVISASAATPAPQQLREI